MKRNADLDLPTLFQAAHKSDMKDKQIGAEGQKAHRLEEIHMWFRIFQVKGCGTATKLMPHRLLMCTWCFNPKKHLIFEWKLMIRDWAPCIRLETAPCPENTSVK